jgi:hypothetical protein
MGVIIFSRSNRLAYGRGGLTEYGIPFLHQTAQGITIRIVANLFEQRRRRIGIPEPHQWKSAII